MIKKSKKGWIVETSGYSEHYGCYVAGAIDGKKSLVYYKRFPEVSPDADLDADYNELYTNAEYIEQMAKDYQYDSQAVKILHRGTIIR